jgi:hypothetical protein
MIDGKKQFIKASITQKLCYFKNRFKKQILAGLKIERNDDMIYFRKKNRFRISISKSWIYIDYITKYGGYNYKNDISLYEENIEKVADVVYRYMQKAPKFSSFEKKQSKPKVTPYEFSEPGDNYEGNQYISNCIIWAKAKVVVLEGEKIIEDKESLAKPGADAWFLIRFKFHNNESKTGYGTMLFDGDKFTPVRDTGGILGFRYISENFQNPLLSPRVLTIEDRDILRGLVKRMNTCPTQQK